jgi:hypothetical protein
MPEHPQRLFSVLWVEVGAQEPQAARAVFVDQRPQLGVEGGGEGGMGRPLAGSIACARRLGRGPLLVILALRRNRRFLDLVAL